MSENLKFDRQFFRDLWQLLKPYWQSEEKWSAFLLLFVIIACIVAQIRLSVAFNYLRKDLFDALQNFNKPLLFHLIGKYIFLLVIAILIFGYNVYFNGLLTIRWRRWLTQCYLADWLTKHTYYRMQVINKTVDNPDQRISEDLSSFPTAALSIFSNLLDSLLTLFAFGFILWNVSGSLTVPLGAYGHFSLPGYLLWAALFYACAGTWLNAKIGRPLANFNYLQQRYNADFRFSMARLREVSEQVAMYRGETVENNKFTQFFKNIFDNFISIIKVQKRLVFFQNGYTAITYVFAILISMPLYFSKKIQIGGVVQISNALDNVITAFSVFITLFVVLANWRSVIFRLTEFSQTMRETRNDAATSKINIAEHPEPNVVVNDLDLLLPDNTPLLEHIQLTIKSGEMLLLTGASGVGKSTLLRALAGIWSYGRGTILTPKNQKTMFLPQKPYLPLGTLREALLYPTDSGDISNVEINQALTLCGLEKLQSELENTRNWSQELSLGEQQLIAFARLFLQKPDWIFLDEATSALDETNERKMYEKLREHLPKAAIVSVGHRSSLSQFHERKIEFMKK
jgi:putative ATP-binding cassette transporter